MGYGEYTHHYPFSASDFENSVMGWVFFFFFPLLLIDSETNFSVHMYVSFAEMYLCGIYLT